MCEEMDLSGKGVDCGRYGDVLVRFFLGIDLLYRCGIVNVSFLVF